ncbi:MAG: TerB family tellurite resistance protein [Bacteroidota bacterium]
MGRFGKWIGGGLGWAMGGPIGGLLGFLVGSMIDSTSVMTSSYTTTDNRTTPGAFTASLLVLIAAVMKADGKVLKSELDYVKQFFLRQFGRESAAEATMMLKDLLNQNIPINDVCTQIDRNMDYSSRLQLLQLLYSVSMADGSIHPSEIQIIDSIAGLIGISHSDLLSIKNMFVPETDSAYRILEIEPTATNDDVKKAYRRMAVKYHPDKVSHLGEEFRKTADEKFRKVNEAYEKVKKERNMV